jgi:hypothetical protein
MLVITGGYIYCSQTWLPTPSFRRAVQVHRPTLQDLVAEADLVLEQILQVVVASRCELLGMAWEIPR